MSMIQEFARNLVNKLETGQPHEQELMELSMRLGEMMVEAKAYADVIEEARDTYCNEEIEIDDEPDLSIADGGVWVSAWVWVQTFNEDEEEEA